jgi:pyruvate ferredoxin oxidoreductase alpha subunit
MRNALKKIQEVNAEYAKYSGRSHGDGLVDAYKLDDAEVAVVVVGSTAGTLKFIVDQLRQEGVKAGVLRLRTFRPFPIEQLRSALKNVKTFAVMDKAMSFGGFGGAVFSEVRNAFYDSKAHPTIVNYIFGLGGRDTNPRDLRKIYDDLLQINKTGNAETTVRFLGLRE